jgi:hypothetical protein
VCAAREGSRRSLSCFHGAQGARNSLSPRTHTLACVIPRQIGEPSCTQFFGRAHKKKTQGLECLCNRFFLCVKNSFASSIHLDSFASFFPLHLAALALSVPTPKLKNNKLFIQFNTKYTTGKRTKKHTKLLSHCLTVYTFSPRFT